MSAQSKPLDLLVIGGGINGVGVARDAVGRGLSVALCEKEDLAQHTSSASTKLIHGGLRYLEHYDFALVRHALQEREVLLQNAPHIIWPLRFILPHHQSLRPKWLIRLGLFLYDHIGGRKKLPASNSVDFQRHPSGEVLDPQFRKGFEYSDCWVQDARLVVLNAMDAAQRGANIYTRTQCVGLEEVDGLWQATLLDTQSQTKRRVQAKAVVNAAGPWVEKIHKLGAGDDGSHTIRLVKGSHIVVPKLFDHPYPYIFQNGDGRILFAIPYEKHYTLLGTTDIQLDGEPGPSQIEANEITYICRAVSEYFNKTVSPADVVWSFSGVRPLYDNDTSANASKVTRDYELVMAPDTQAPLLSIYGGKITTYRRLAEDVLELLSAKLPLDKAWTHQAPLPGGDIPDANFEDFVKRQTQRYHQLPSELIYDYCRNYGTRISSILQGVEHPSQLGQHFGGLLYEAEVNYLCEHEWAQSAEDILWRRSKKGLQLTEQQTQALAQYLTQTPQAEQYQKRA